MEYVLLLAVAVGIAFAIRAALTKTGDTPENSGAIVKQWDAMEQAVGADDPNHHP